MMTSPMLLDHCDARVASQQSSILRKGVYSLPMKCPLDKSKKKTIQIGCGEKTRRDFGSPGIYGAGGSMLGHRTEAARSSEP